VILDAFSRRVVGWALDRSLDAGLALEALCLALARRRPAPGLVHHSDRSLQYASRDYLQLLRDRGIQISMSRKANPWDNAACESFIKTLKYEEVYRTEYRDLAAGRVRARAAHSKPEGGRCAASCLMSFLRHGEIYPFDEGVVGENALAHRMDEFRAGYSSTGCSPTVPASASPAVICD
jgi:transposase InsO family protein